MLKVSKIINQETKEVSICDENQKAHFILVGYSEMDVEQAYDGSWYLAGYTPEKPQELIKQERIAELQRYLKDTDWYATRFAETGVEIHAEIKLKRQEARDEISELRGE